jgi:hypothetical protein
MDGYVLRCSFCDRAPIEVEKLIAGPPGRSAYICGICVAECVDIINEGKPATSPPSPQTIRQEEMNVRPSFRNLAFTKRQDHCFYLSPFCEPFNTIYDGYVTPGVTVEGFTIVRADQIYGTEPIIEDIWAAINEAEFVIADITGRNANVTYEIGIAHTVGKPVIMVTQNIEDVPFDLRHLRCIVYSNSVEGYKQLQNKIAATLRRIRRGAGAG